MDDDAESIITNQRYAYIGRVVEKAVHKQARTGNMTVSDRIDRIVTNRILALPIFVVIMGIIYSIAMGQLPISIGTKGTDWANDVLFGEIVPGLFDKLLLNAQGEPVVAHWLYGLIQDGIVAGVGAVLGFVPQILVLCFLLAILEDVGYMARVAFVMDRIFRRFGLSGKSFIPLLVATSAFFIGIAAVVISGVMLKKFKAFAGDPAPFVMELPAYHVPAWGNVLRATAERGWSFIKRAGTIILVSSVVLWFLQGYGFVDGVFAEVEDNNHSLLAAIGNAVAWIFYPLGWMGDMAWKATVATVTGLIAKEEVVNTFGVLYNYAGDTDLMQDSSPIWGAVAADFGAVRAYSFMIFNLLCAPCFAAMGAIKREMNNPRWTLGAIGYMCAFAYVIAMIVYQLGGLITGEASFGPFTVAALVALAVLVYLVVRPNPYKEEKLRLDVRKVVTAK